MPERTVLIVDDDARVRANLSRWLSDASWRVQTTDRCDRAQIVARTFVPACLVSEQKLDDGSGFELFTRLRAVNPALKAIMVTGHASVAGAVHAVRIGFEDYLAKPIEPRRVAARLDQQSTARPVGPSPDTTDDVFGHGGQRPSLARVEWEHINAILYSCDGNISEAARVLGLHRRSLQRKLRRQPRVVEAAAPRP
jgi:two-component system, response regulator RegA